MSTQLKLECYRTAGSMREARELYEWLTTEAPAEPEAEPVAPDVEIPEGFTRWDGNWAYEQRGTPIELAFPSGVRLQTRFGYGQKFISENILAYRIIEAPTSSPSTDEGRSDPGSEEEVRDQIEIPEGFTKWEGGLERPMPIGTPIEVFYRDGTIQSCLAGDEWSEFWWTSKTLIDHPSDRDIIAYRILSQPEAQSEEEEAARQNLRDAVAFGGAENAAEFYLCEEGWIPWSGGECPVEQSAVVEYQLRGADAPPLDPKPAFLLRWDHAGVLGDIIAYRVVAQPTEWPDPTAEAIAAYIEGETHTDDLRTAEGEIISGEPWEMSKADAALSNAICSPSITSDPDFVAAVSRAEATLAAAGGGAYVGLQDPELDADWDAMKEREAAEKAKPKFSIWGGKREKVGA